MAKRRRNNRGTIAVSVAAIRRTRSSQAKDTHNISVKVVCPLCVTVKSGGYFAGAVARESGNNAFQEIGQGGKAVLKAFVSEVTTGYWQENRQIPFAESFSELKDISLELLTKNVAYC